MSAIIEIMVVPPFIPVPDVKKYFGWDRRYVWNLLKKGAIKGSRDGRKWTIKTASIMKFLKRYENVTLKED